MNGVLVTDGRIFSAGILLRGSSSTNKFVRLTDPAVDTMNDFTRECPVTVDEERQIDAALDDMIRFGVRALLVVRGVKVLGLITSYDIEGEHPIQYMQRSNYNRRQDIQVSHLMTGWADLSTLSWQSVKDARVADVLVVFHRTILTHLLVVESMGEATASLRGLFSRTRIERQLGYLPAMAPAMTA